MRVSCKLTSTIVSLAALLWAAADAPAQRLASGKRGLGAANTFAVSEIDHVNLLNGNLILTLPLGISYTVGPALSYQAVLVYNGNSWDYERINCPAAYMQPVTSKESNAGHGWMLSFGAIDGNSGVWVYMSPDGASHAFYSQLHPGYPATTDPDVLYTNDGTNLRMRYDAANAGALCKNTALTTKDCRVVEFRNGNVLEFRDFSTNPENSLYRITRMRDSDDNYVDFSYPDNTTWAIHDSHGREQLITFAATATPYTRITQVRLAGFGGGTSIYTFQYVSETIDRQGFNSGLCNADPTIQVSLLDRLVQPDDSYYELDYYKTEDPPDFLSGGVASLRLPTGGKYAWTYGYLSFISQDPRDIDPLPVRSAFGVFEKAVYENANDVTPMGVWAYEYDYNLSPNAPGDSAVPCHHETIVTDPVGNQTVHYFTTSFESHRWSYGLPFTRCDPNVGAYSNVGPFLSMEVFDGPRAPASLRRSVYVEYGSDGPEAGGSKDNQEKNHRLRYRKTVFNDDGDRYSEVTFSDFDGLGNFRARAEDGSFTVTQDDRSFFTDYNPGRGTLVVDPETSSTAGSTFVMPGTTERWLFGTYTTQELTAAGETARVEACFDSDTGFLLRQRVLVGSSPGNSDVLSVYTPTAQGQVARELVYGGDTSTLALDNVYPTLCDMTLPAGSAAQYRTDHSYTSGVLSKSVAVDACNAAELLVLTDVDVDAGTGLVSASRDSAGIETAFTYDLMGRLTGERPPSSAWVTYDYQMPTEASPTVAPKLAVLDCLNGVTGCSAANALTWQKYFYDGLGRMEEERIRIPGETGVIIRTRTSEYNPLGWKTSESVWGNTSLKTTYSHDHLGRVLTIQPPGGNPATTFAYEGERIKTRATQVMQASGLGWVYTTEIYNNRGKLVTLCENRAAPWSGTCDGLKTAYTYDVGDRLTHVCLNKPSSGACGQVRNFVYDLRGFLASERHPEVGPSGNGWTYYDYDARGNVVRKDVGSSTEFDLRYSYDRVGRLTEVWEENGTRNDRLLKQYFYAYANNGADLRGGKLVQTVRTNWVGPVGPLATLNPGQDKALISETYEYKGRDGRVSGRQTRFKFGNLALAFDFWQTYDAGGNLTSITYPNGEHYEYTYDSSNMMKHLESNRDQARVFLYNADDERVAQFDCPYQNCTSTETFETWTLRNLHGKLLRIYGHLPGQGWSFIEDYINGENRVLAAIAGNVSGDQEISLHLDHLGTPRQASTDLGIGDLDWSYYPFGDEASSPEESEGVTIGFLGAERDRLTTSTTGLLDYQHARFSKPSIGRFSSTDPVRLGIAPTEFYNRYSFNFDNPVNFTDPDGRFPLFFPELFLPIVYDTITVTARKRPKGPSLIEKIWSSFKGRSIDARMNGSATSDQVFLPPEAEKRPLFGFACDATISPTVGLDAVGGGGLGGGFSLRANPPHRVELTLIGGLGFIAGGSVFGGLSYGKSAGWGLGAGGVGGMPAGFNGAISGNLSEPGPSAALGVGVGGGEGLAGGVSYTFVLYNNCD